MCFFFSSPWPFCFGLLAREALLISFQPKNESENARVSDEAVERAHGSRNVRLPSARHDSFSDLILSE
jgi:hypothetical protein